MIVGANASAVIDTYDGSTALYERDPGGLVAAAAADGMPVCSVELQRLVTASQPAGPGVISVEEALIECGRLDLRDMLDRLSASKLPSSRVIIGTNVGLTMGGSDRETVAYFDDDVVRLLRAARQLYIRACIVVPETLQVETFPGNVSPGLSIEEALARCGI
jgi:hypothetical protein